MSVFKKIIKFIILILPLLFLTALVLDSYSIISFFQGNKEYISDMKRQVKKGPQESSTFSGGLSLNSPDDSPIPRNNNIYKLGPTEYEKADSLYPNPLELTDEVLERGKNRYEIFCIHCHGPEGRGDGPVITNVELTETEEGFPAPPSYLRAETRAFSDSRIFHIISSGQNAMFAAGHKIDEADRWAIVHYVRHLQNKYKDNEE